jgi:hypothetical protein
MIHAWVGLDVRRFIRGLMCGVVLTLVVLFPMPAQAFFVPGLAVCGSREDFGYGFDGPNWTDDRKNWFRDGENRWNAVLNSTGGFVSFAWEGGSIEIQIADVVAGQGGVTYCFAGGLNRIVIDVFAMNQTAISGDSFRGVSTHEVGHAFGLAHGGPKDSWNGASIGSAPTMASGCFIDSSFTFASLYSLESDDWAALVSRRSPEIQSNASFESGLTKWTAVSGSWAVPGSGGHIGSRYAQISGSGAYLFQRVRVTDPTDLTPRLSIKKSSSSATGTIRVQVRASQLDYDSSGRCTSDLPKGWDFESPSAGSWTTIVDQSFTPTMSWVAITSIPEWTAVNGWEGADVEIRVYNQLSTGTADVDYVRTNKT